MLRATQTKKISSRSATSGHNDMLWLTITTTTVSMLLHLTAVAPHNSLAEFSEASVSFHLNGSEGAFMHLRDEKHIFNSPNWSFNFEFRTNLSSGLLVYVDDQKSGSFMQLRVTSEVVSGQVECRIQTPPSLSTPVVSGNLQHLVMSVGSNVNDNHWHKLVIDKVLNIVTLKLYVQLHNSSSEKLPQSLIERRTLQSADLFVDPVRIFFGGIGSNLSKHFSALANPSVIFEPRFRGVFQNIQLNSNMMDHMDFISSFGVEVENHNIPTGELHFCDPSSHLSVAQITENGQLFTTIVSLQFRTLEPNGLLIFYRTESVANVTAFFIAAELFQGHLVIVLPRPRSSQVLEKNTGKTKEKEQRSLSLRIVVSTHASHMHDGHWHNFTLTLNKISMTGQVLVDDGATEFLLNTYSDFAKAEATTLFSLGQGPSSPLRPFYSELWSLQSNISFRGAIRGVKLNGEELDVTHTNATLLGRCTKEKAQVNCDSAPCYNSGRCRKGWKRYLCDCTSTGFYGDECQHESPITQFSGKEPVAFSLPEPIRGRQLTDWTFRFRTGLRDAFLFRISGCAAKSHNTGHLSISIQANELQVTLVARTSTKEKIKWAIVGNISDNEWHAFSFHRHGKLVRVLLDRREQIRENINALDGHLFFYCNLAIGGEQKYSLKRSVRPRRSLSSKPPNFVGALQDVIFDGIRIPLPSQQHDLSVTVKNETVSSLSFTNPSGFFELSPLKAEHHLKIEFSFKTLEPNGLILFNGKSGHDFIAVELIHGRVHFVFDVGNGAEILQSSPKHKLNNNQWHVVQILRVTKTVFTMTVDGHVTKQSTGKTKHRFNLDGMLYIGGIPNQMYSLLPRVVFSQHGFVGCLSGLKMNELTPELLIDANVTVKHDFVGRGCGDEHGPPGVCPEEICANGGHCVQQWTGYRCNCDMTSFTGYNCSTASTAYRFGPLPGLIIYHFDFAQRLDSRADQIAFGLITMEDEAIIGRVASFTSDDITEFQVVGGHLFVIYNMGTQAHLISDLQHRVNDNGYHTVRFERTGANATLQVDHHSPVFRAPSGKQLDTFNGISTVEIGGKLNAKLQTIERPFHGIISGFFLNGLRILDLAAEGDTNTIIDGYPEQVDNMAQELIALNQSTVVWQKYPNWLDEMQLMETANSDIPESKATDDLITIVPKECPEEDESCMLIDNSNRDELIFAQYTVLKTTKVATSKLLTTAPSTTSNQRAKHLTAPCDDDEDCDMESSGDTSLLSPRSPISRTTRPPIIINVTFTAAASAITSTDGLSQSNQTPTRHYNNPVNFTRGLMVNGRVETKVKSSQPENFFVEYAAIIAGIAVALIILVALIVFFAVRCKKRSSNRNPRTIIAVTSATDQNSSKTYQTFLKPQPSPSPSDTHRNGNAPPSMVVKETNARSSLRCTTAANDKDREWCV